MHVIIFVGIRCGYRILFPGNVSFQGSKSYWMQTYAENTKAKPAEVSDDRVRFLVSKEKIAMHAVFFPHLAKTQFGQNVKM